MKDFIKKQQELARNSATGFIFNQINEPNERYQFSPEDLDTLIQQIITNTGAEIMEWVSDPKNQTGVDLHNRRWIDVDDIKQHIKDVTE